jgi:methylmalonyl-CoA mutase, N-terminal domain
VVVGVNAYIEGGAQTSILKIDPTLEGKQLERVRAAKSGRDGAALHSALAALRTAARDGTNLMPLLIDAARLHASEGGIVESLQQVWGDYRETAMF